MTTREETAKQWADAAAKILTGRTVKAVRYLTPDEADALGWHRASLSIELDDGTVIIPSADAEYAHAWTIFDVMRSRCP